MQNKINPKLYISKKIITPIHALNQNAKKLGKEDVEFNVKGYQEIEEGFVKYFPCK